MPVDLLRLREALEASWDAQTSYRGAFQAGNPALGQCYPTARVVQLFCPEFEIVVGDVWTGTSVETHFWNAHVVEGNFVHLDFSWQQFPHGSSVRKWKILDRTKLQDSQPTIERCDLLRRRVAKFMATTEV